MQIALSLAISNAVDMFKWFIRPWGESKNDDLRPNLQQFLFISAKKKETSSTELK